MNIVGQKVKHATFGVGEVVSLEDTYMEVHFDSKDKTVKFKYPDAFRDFVVAEDDTTQEAIIHEIAAIDKEAEEKKAQEEQRKQEELARQNEEKAKAERKARVSRDLPRIQSARETGKPLFFYVFQGNSFNEAMRGGYIWAPISNKAGLTFHHWDRLLDVLPGDIILHGCDGQIKAISIAKSACYDCTQPEELRTNDLWEVNGRRVDCEYIPLDNPIKTSAFISDIQRLSVYKYAPFDKDGNGNMGYLYELIRELAKIFVTEIIRLNPYIGTNPSITSAIG